MATITREHPLRGLPLPIIRLVRRHGRLELLLQTPDGCRRFVPLEWTDVATATPALPSLTTKRVPSRVPMIGMHL